MVDPTLVIWGIKFASIIIEEVTDNIQEASTTQRTKPRKTVKKITPYEEIMNVLKKITAMPISKIEEMISTLKNNSENKEKEETISILDFNKKTYNKKEKHSLSSITKGYLDWDERKTLRKIGNSEDLREFLEFILEAKIKLENLKKQKEMIKNLQ